jgi:hypothetical protein
VRDAVAHLAGADDPDLLEIGSHEPCPRRRSRFYAERAADAMILSWVR